MDVLLRCVGRGDEDGYESGVREGVRSTTQRRDSFRGRQCEDIDVACLSSTQSCSRLGAIDRFLPCVFNAEAGGTCTSKYAS